MWKTLIRPAMIAVPFILGVLFQNALHWSWRAGDVDLARWAIRGALMAMFFLIVLQLKLSRLRLRREHWMLLAVNVLMGVVPYAILRVAGYEELALAAFFVGITPTANAAPVVMDFLHGQVGFVLSGFVLTNLGIDLLLIGLLPLMTGQLSWGFTLEVLLQLLMVVGIPLVLATLLRLWRPSLRDTAGRFKMPSFALWCFTLFVIACTATEYVESTGADWSDILPIALVSATLCAANFTIGALIAPKKLRRECSQTLGQKNTTLTIFLALAFGGPHAAMVALGPTFYVLWHNSWNAVQMFMYDRRKLQGRRRKRRAMRRGLKTPAPPVR